jgi:hypothetical protein
MRSLDRRRDIASTIIAVLMCRADRNRSRVITSNKAGKTGTRWNEEKPGRGPVFCFPGLRVRLCSGLVWVCRRSLAGGDAGLLLLRLAVGLIALGLR